MSVITVKLSAREIELLASLAADQLFRREFIDSRLPGFRSDPAELSAGKKVVERLRLLTDRSKRAPLAKKNSAAV
jgi:hypothetical protein